MATAEVKEEQKVYVYLPPNYDKGERILSWALNHFSKDEVKIVATVIVSSHTKFNHLQHKTFLSLVRNITLDKYLAQCAIQKFKAEKLIHEIDHLVEGTLGLIDVKAITNLVMGFSPKNSITSALSVAEKANPTCKIWFINLEGNILFTRSDLTEASSEERIRREKLHQKEIEEIRKRENDKNDLLRRGKEELKFENQLLKNQLKDLDKQKQQLRKLNSDLEIAYNKLKQERNNAIKEAQELRKQKEHSFANSDMVLSSQFSLIELEQATHNFSDSLKIGEGGFGCVYKGSLRNTTVAIKKLNSESLQGLSEFQQEVTILNRVRHPNIVNLIGSCLEISTLVYEFLPNGSLEDRLTCADNTSSLTWQARIRIISDICLGKRAINIANEVQEGMRAGRLLSIVDQSAGKWPLDLTKKLAKLGLRCADISRRRRPDMSQVWTTIEPLLKVASQFHNEEHVPSHFICPIMQEIMKNPCIAADGFTYEGEAIKIWLNGGRNTSPMTNMVLPHHDLIQNHVLRSAIQEWLQQHPQSN